MIKLSFEFHKLWKRARLPALRNNRNCSSQGDRRWAMS